MSWTSRGASSTKLIISLILITVLSLLLLVHDRWRFTSSVAIGCLPRPQSQLETTTTGSHDVTFREKYLRMVHDVVLGLAYRTREKSIAPGANLATLSNLVSSCAASVLNCPVHNSGGSAPSSSPSSSAEETEDDGLIAGPDKERKEKTRATLRKFRELLSCEGVGFDKEKRRLGHDWPMLGLTMIGEIRLDSLRSSIESVIKDRIAGDFVECGVWRGGASMYVKALIDSLDTSGERLVWLVDSFAGLPPPVSGMFHLDTKTWSELDYLRVSLDEVQENFRSLHLLDDRVKFCKGFFVDSLPKCGCKKRSISVLRMDGDMYQSTMDILFNLYPQVVVQGHVIIDDWNIRPTQEAIKDFFRWHKIEEDIKVLEDGSAHFIKTKSFALNITLYQELLDPWNSQAHKKQ